MTTIEGRNRPIPGKPNVMSIWFYVLDNGEALYHKFKAEDEAQAYLKHYDKFRAAGFDRPTAEREAFEMAWLVHQQKQVV